METPVISVKKPDNPIWGGWGRGAFFNLSTDFLLIFVCIAKFFICSALFAIVFASVEKGSVFPCLFLILVSGGNMDKKRSS